MNDVQGEIARLYREKLNIHITVKLANLRQVLDSVPAKIVGMYNIIFQVEIKGDLGRIERHSYRFCDVLIGQVKIRELDISL